MAAGNDPAPRWRARRRLDGQALDDAVRLSLDDAGAFDDAVRMLLDDGGAFDDAVRRIVDTDAGEP